MDKYRVTLTIEERAELEHLVSVGKGAARKLTHARILLLADTAAGGQYFDDEIVAALGSAFVPLAASASDWLLRVSLRLLTTNRNRYDRTRSR